MGFADKLLSLGSLPAWRAEQRRLGRRVVVTNGCFDLLHLGHATYLEAAKAQGDLLLVGVNSDASVRALKGPSRPINREADRAALIAALGSVDAVCLFEEPSALAFLRVAEPDVWAKGADYSLETLNQEERRAVESLGGRIAFLTLVPGKSTTGTLRAIEGIEGSAMVRTPRET
ncbi:MAG: adenylyltransferase/cytidyltransferase family protein [Verrucomicrobiales bacterium]|nr:adenylyltransferase/cytidyltransferase family protein [Verrucomicrobiales bacterium]